MTFEDAAKKAWHASFAGKFGEAAEYYRQADSLMGTVTDERGPQFNPGLSVLRHGVGVGTGRVVSITATEDLVSCFTIGGNHLETPESPNADGMAELEIRTWMLAKNIRTFMQNLDLGHHPENIKEHRPHVLVMSTGRCGTVSLHRLLIGSNLNSYHTFWWNLPTASRINMSCQLVSGDFRDEEIPDVWLTCRAAEWLGGTMIGLNHLDTIFAPTFAAMHPKSRFVYIIRDSVDVFKSFYGKNQWGVQQLRPVHYKFTPDFHWRRTEQTVPQMIAWYLRFTEEFSRAFGSVLGNRFLGVRAESLFAQDRDAISELLDFIGSDVPLDRGVDHFGVKINEKKHKACVGPAEMDRACAEFKEAYCQFS